MWVRNLFDARYAQQGFFFGLIPPNYPNQAFLQQGDPRQVGLTVNFALGSTEVNDGTYDAAEQQYHRRQEGEPEAQTAGSRLFDITRRVNLRPTRYTTPSAAAQVGLK